MPPCRDTLGIFAALTRGMTPVPSVVDSGPISPTIFFESRLRAPLTVVCGSDLMSTTSSTSMLPLIPPAAFT